jgi:hypothetical protein
MNTWQVIGIIGVIAIIQCWVLAVVLYRVGAPGSMARKLGLLLAVEGLTLATAGYPESIFNIGDNIYTDYPIYAQLSFMVHTLGDSAMIALYPPFLAAALQTPLTRPFGGKRGRIACACAAAALFIAVQLSSLKIGATLLYLSLSLLFGFALVASIVTWRAAAPGIARTRAGVFAAAFGLRDICWGLVYGVSIWTIWIGAYLNSAVETDLDAPMKLIYALGTLIAVPIISYGILRTQLFDIDLRIRWTIKQSTLAGIFVALMFLISEGASVFFSAELGNVAGLLAAAVVVFFLAPLQRFAERVAGAAMPNTRDTPEYVSYRKMKVYEAAVAEALQEGGISAKERSLLIRLRDSLGIPESDAEAIEQDLQMRDMQAMPANA